MDRSTSTKYTSFVIRFVEEPRQDSATGSDYRGVIRHVQTDEEITFSDWRIAERFIHRFVPIETMSEADDSRS